MIILIILTIIIITNVENCPCLYQFPIALDPVRMEGLVQVGPVYALMDSQGYFVTDQVS